MKSVMALVILTGGASLAAAGFLQAAQPAQTLAKSIKECSNCPELVIIPAGQFMMGSPPGELYRGDEKLHRVTIKAAFALAKYEVTFAQWDACVADRGCGGVKPDDQGWGRGNRPVVGVNWHDAKAYVAWLSRKTGKAYRLPSEAEWEYAARAGAATPFSFGATITTTQANYDGSSGYGAGPKGVNRGKTVPVGSFPSNAFGLHDMHGNVWEWVEDCWSDGYGAATPANGEPYRDASCKGHAMRGGSWEDYPGDVRAAARVGSGSDEQSWADGFRVARSVN